MWCNSCFNNRLDSLHFQSDMLENEVQRLFALPCMHPWPIRAWSAWQIVFFFFYASQRCCSMKLHANIRNMGVGGSLFSKAAGMNYTHALSSPHLLPPLPHRMGAYFQWTQMKETFKWDLIQSSQNRDLAVTCRHPTVRRSTHAVASHTHLRVVQIHIHIKHSSFPLDLAECVTLANKISVASPAETPSPSVDFYLPLFFQLK